MTRQHSSYAGSNVQRLVASILDQRPFAGRSPDHELDFAKRLPVAPDWRARAVKGSECSFEFGDTRLWVTNEKTVWISGFDPGSASAIARHVSNLECDIATFTVGEAVQEFFQPEPIGIGHYDLGWAIAFKGDGHEKYLSSRRWLEAGAWRVDRAENDVSVISFTDRAKTPEEQAADCARLHPRFSEGFLAPNHHRGEVKGIYSDTDRLLRITVVDRDVTPNEMLDACFCRGDKIANVAFVFFDRANAEKHKHELWLRGLEVRLVEVATEERLA